VKKLNHEIQTAVHPDTHAVLNVLGVNHKIYIFSSQKAELFAYIKK